MDVQELAKDANIWAYALQMYQRFAITHLLRDLLKE